jgi:hypothetical protein
MLVGMHPQLSPLAAELRFNELLHRTPRRFARHHITPARAEAPPPRKPLMVLPPPSTRPTANTCDQRVA